MATDPTYMTPAEVQAKLAQLEAQQGLQTHAIAALLAGNLTDGPQSARGLLVQLGGDEFKGVQPGIATLPKADPAPAPTPTRLVQAIDVSSNNGLDIGPWLVKLNPDHVIVKLYQSVERGLDGYTIAHARTAKGFGKTVGGYVWLYAGIPGERQVQDALNVAQRAGITLPILWLDCEQYTDGSDPNGDIIRAAVAEAQRQGVKVGVYTGEWWWDGRDHPLRGSTEFHELPLWYADYSRTPTLDVPDFGGWTVAGAHQYTSTPVDRSIIRSDLAGL